MIWARSVSSDVKRQTFQQHGIHFVDEEVGSFGTVSKTSGPCNWRKSCVLSSRSSASMRTSEFCQSGAFSVGGGNELQRSADRTVWDFSTESLPLVDRLSPALVMLTISVHWNSLQLNSKQVEQQSIRLKIV